MPQFAEPVPGSGGKAFQVRQDGERVRLELTEAHGRHLRIERTFMDVQAWLCSMAHKPSL